MFKALLSILFCVTLYADSINFDFIDARKKGYTDKEILDYVSKNLNSYDINSLRQTGISDKEIIDFFIQRDSVNMQLNALSNSIDNGKQINKIVSPQEISLTLSFGCLIYIGKIKQQKNGWIYVEKLKDFAIATYTMYYLKEADYFDINKSNTINLKNICATWIGKLNNKEEVAKLYAVSLANEIEKLVKQKKSLTID